MKGRWCLTLALCFVLPTMFAQKLGSQIPARKPGIPPPECNPVKGILGASLLECDTSQLAGLVSEASVSNLYSVLQKQLGADLKDKQVPKLYIDPTTLGREEGEDPTVVRITPETKIQVFGERRIPIEASDPCFAYGIRVKIERVAMPADGAKSLREILTDKEALNRCIQDLRWLEVVAVPKISNPDPQVPCELECEPPCFRVSTLVLIPGKVFEDKTSQPGGTTAASFTAVSSTLRKNKQRLERGTDEFNSWIRHEQKDRQNACFTRNQVLLWANGRLKEWRDFWDEVEKGRKILKQEEEKEGNWVPAQESAKPGGSKPAQAPKITRKPKPPTAKKPVP